MKGHHVPGKREWRLKQITPNRLSTPCCPWPKVQPQGRIIRALVKLSVVSRISERGPKTNYVEVKFKIDLIKIVFRKWNSTASRKFAPVAWGGFGGGWKEQVLR